jgi:hypothetical protein
MSGQGMLGSLIGAGQQSGMATHSSQLQNAQAQMNSQQAWAAAQQAHIQQLGRYNQALAPQWMINGRTMSIEDFGKEMFGDDTPELTMFLLKYKDVEQK